MTDTPETEAPVATAAPTPAGPPVRRKRGRPPGTKSKLQRLHDAEKEAELKAHEESLRATGIFDTPIPEAQALKEAPEDVVGKLSKAEKDRISLAEAMKRAA